VGLTNLMGEGFFQKRAPGKKEKERGSGRLVRGGVKRAIKKSPVFG